MDTLIGPFAWYVRKSDSKSDLQRQILLLAAFCKENKIAVPESLRYQDTGSRDLSRRRPQFQQMLKDAARGKFKTLLVPALDRFGVEDTEEFFRYRSELRDAGVSIFSIDPSEGDLSSKEKETIIKIFFKAEASKEEQIKKGSRAISGKHKQLLYGLPSFQGGPCPYGYDKQCVTSIGEILWTLHYQGPQRRIAHMPDGSSRRFDGDKNTHPVKARSDRILLVPSMDTKRIEAVKLIFDLWVNKDLSILGICKRLNALKAYKPFTGEFWKPTAVRGILDNPVYAGNLVFNRRKWGRFASVEKGKEIHHNDKEKHRKYWRAEDQWIIVPNAHPALVSADVVDRSREKLKALKDDNSRPPRHPDLWLRRFAYCGHCGRRMEARHVGKHAYLVCGTYKDGNAIGVPAQCTFNSVRHDKVEKIVTDHFAEVFERLKGNGNEVYERIVKDYYALVHDWWKVDRDFVHWVFANVAFQFGIEIPPDEWSCWRKLEEAMVGRAEVREFVAKQREEWDAKITRQLEEKEQQHRTLTRRWATASDEQITELTEVRDELEAEIKILRSKLSHTVIDTLENIIALAQSFKSQLAVFQKTVRTDDNLAKAEALKPILKKIVLFFRPKTSPKAKSHMEKWQFEYCDSNDTDARGSTAPRTGRPARAGSSGCCGSGPSPGRARPGWRSTGRPRCRRRRAGRPGPRCSRCRRRRPRSSGRSPRPGGPRSAGCPSTAGRASVPGRLPAPGHCGRSPGGRTGRARPPGPRWRRRAGRAGRGSGPAPR